MTKNDHTKAIRVVVYLRIGARRQLGQELNVQKKALISSVKSLGMQPIEFVCDADSPHMSDSSWLKIVDCADKGEAKALVINKLSHIGRDPFFVGQRLVELSQLGIDIISLKDYPKGVDSAKSVYYELINRESVVAKRANL